MKSDQTRSLAWLFNGVVVQRFADGVGVTRVCELDGERCPVAVTRRLSA